MALFFEMLFCEKTPSISRKNDGKTMSFYSIFPFQSENGTKRIWNSERFTNTLLPFSECGIPQSFRFRNRDNNDLKRNDLHLFFVRVSEDWLRVKSFLIICHVTFIPISEDYDGFSLRFRNDKSFLLRNSACSSDKSLQLWNSVLFRNFTCIFGVRNSENGFLKHEKWSFRFWHFF